MRPRAVTNLDLLVYQYGKINCNPRESYLLDKLTLKEFKTIQFIHMLYVSLLFFKCNIHTCVLNFKIRRQSFGLAS